MLDAEFEKVSTHLDALSAWRKKSWDLFSSLGGLDFKKESFQYVQASDFTFLPRAKEISEPAPTDKNFYKIVFVDGYFSEKLSHLPDNVVCLSIEEAMKPYGVFLQTRMQKTLKEELDPLALLNGAFQSSGVFVYVPSFEEVSEVVVIEHMITQNAMATPKMILHLGKNAKLKLEMRMQVSAQNPLMNGLMDISLDESAHLTLKNVQEQNQGKYFQAIRLALKRASNCKGYFYSEGSDLSRVSIKAQLLEEDAEVLLQGVTQLNPESQSHIHARLEHLAPNTRSRQHFKALVEDEARSSFEGKIYVDSTAIKTESYQLCNHLLLGDKALGFAKPNLEIFADDVKASHGSTVSQIDEESLFYLKSRGIGFEEARALLVTSFVQELKNCLP